MSQIAHGRRAVVLGGGIAGLLAARVLSDRFDHVTIVEKDVLAKGPDVRKTVPQGAHVHGLLARGCQIIERLFPGITAQLIAEGTSPVGVDDARIYILGWRKTYTGDDKILSMTRPFLEGVLARRVLSIANVTAVEQSDAFELVGTAARVTGVNLRNESGTQELTADLIVDARGRSSNLSDWMRALGTPSPPHETSPLASVYCSYLLEPRRGEKRPAPHQVARFEDKTGVLLFPVEGGRVLLSLGSNVNAKLPQTHEEMLTLLKTLPVPDAFLAANELSPITTPLYSRFTASVRRRFDRLAHPPEGIVAIGDAVASFNPIFGQGMTVAALEAEWLESCLSRDDPAKSGFAKAYYAGVQPIVDRAWGLPDLEARRENPSAQSAAIRFALWYTKRMQNAASRSAHISKTIARVQNMLEPPRALFKPSVFLTVLFA